ncbi:hypothetical protein [Peribacillus alkalitolerans]|uniref:hypothetical protein n=1 Tax=Peribacillus alkalitolerans TaxID=1550385 RepID=UPI0013D4D182|nr:hypothetical protein [Peribacillus alkalitolerans]
MVPKRLMTAMGFLCLLLIFTGCSANVNEEINKAEKAAEKVFTNNNVKANEKLKEFSFYLPDGFKVDEVKTHNVIINNRDIYAIIFVNPNEQSDSDVLIQNFINHKKEYEKIQTFEKPGKKGFFAVRQTEEKKYELIVGIGGVKVTTVAKAADLEILSKDLMKTAISIKQE